MENEVIVYARATRYGYWVINCLDAGVVHVKQLGKFARALCARKIGVPSSQVSIHLL